jgi:anti-sigma factor RsiW
MTHFGPSDQELLLRLLGPAGSELTCEECFAQLDRYVDAQLDGDDADRLIIGMRAHLDGCSACREEHLGLRALARAER